MHVLNFFHAFMGSDTIYQLKKAFYAGLSGIYFHFLGGGFKVYVIITISSSIDSGFISFSNFYGDGFEFYAMVGKS